MAKILIVEDDTINRELLKFRFEKAGHDVRESGNGEEGLLMARNNPPDLVILDVMLPRLDGWKVCRALKKDPATKNVPVLILSCCGQQIEVLQGWESGADDYVTKPCDAADLVRVCEKLIATPRAA